VVCGTGGIHGWRDVSQGMVSARSEASMLTNPASPKSDVAPACPAVTSREAGSTVGLTRQANGNRRFVPTYPWHGRSGWQRAHGRQLRGRALPAPARPLPGPTPCGPFPWPLKRDLRLVRTARVTRTGPAIGIERVIWDAPPPIRRTGVQWRRLYASCRFGPADGPDRPNSLGVTLSRGCDRRDGRELGWVLSLGMTAQGGRGYFGWRPAQRSASSFPPGTIWQC